MLTLVPRVGEGENSHQELLLTHQLFNVYHQGYFFESCFATVYNNTWKTKGR